MLYNLYKKWRFPLLILIIATACTTLDETFSEFSDDPETIYIGAADTIIATSGYEKVRFRIVNNSDPKITKGELKLVSDSTIYKFAILRSNSGKDTTNFDVSIPEGTHRFSVKLFDDVGNKSLEKSILVNVLGDSYSKTLISKPIVSVGYQKNMDPAKVGALVTFDKDYEGLLGLRIKYNDSKGNPIERRTAKYENNVLIKDFEPNGNLLVESIYAPINPFFEFKGQDSIKAKLPACNKLATVSSAINSIAFDTTDTNKSSVKSFEIGSSGCIIGNISLTAEGSYTLGTKSTGPFTSSISFAPSTDLKTVFISFNPTSAKDQESTGSITASAANVLDSAVVKLKGMERGVLTGLQKHPVAKRTQTTKSVFTDDTDVTSSGTGINKLWDGVFAHPSCINSNSSPIPVGFFTADLGGNYVVKEISWMPRTGFANRGFKKYQYWGLPDGIDPAKATTTTVFRGKPENLAAWEREMLSKGWVSLGEYTKTLDNANAALTSIATGAKYIADPINVSNFVRHIRVVVIETNEGASGTINISELDFKIFL